MVDDVLTRNGLPSINSHTGGHDRDYLGLQYDLMEQLLRRDDAADADNTAEVVFIERQIDWMIWQRGSGGWSVSSVSLAIQHGGGGWGTYQRHQPMLQPLQAFVAHLFW